MVDKMKTLKHFNNETNTKPSLTVWQLRSPIYSDSKAFLPEEYNT